MHGLGQRLGLAGALLDDPVDHLLGEQRVAARALGDLRARASPLAGLGAEQRGDQRAGLLAGERLERDRGRVGPPAAPAGAAVEQLVAGQADDQHRAARPARQVLDQVEHPLVGPVDVLDAKSSGWRAAGGLDQRADGREQALAHLLGVVVPRAPGRPVAARRLDPERPPERRGEPLGGLGGGALGESAPRSRRRACARPVPASSVSTISKVPRTISPSAQ